MLFIFVHQLIFGLRRAELVIVNGLELVFAVKLMAFFRLRIAAVEETFFAAPRAASVLDPLQMIAGWLLTRDIKNVEIVPV